MASKLESTPATRFEEAVSAAFGAVGREVKDAAGEPKVLMGMALDMLGRLHKDTKALMGSQKAEALESSAAQRDAERAGKLAGALVTRFHARANRWLWTQREDDAMSAIGVDLGERSFALAQWLEGVNPSAFAAMTTQRQADFMASILPRAGEILDNKDAADKKFLKELEASAQALKDHAEAVDKEGGEAADAQRKVVEALAGELGRRYQAAQDVLRAALRLQDQTEQLGRLMPSLWDTLQPNKRGGAAQDGADEPIVGFDKPDLG
jgi:uncharacterized protein YukE